MCACWRRAQAPRTGPELLDFDELEDLARHAIPRPPLSGRLQRLLNTPFVNNEAWYAGARPHRPERPGLGAMMRAGAWNIERGLEFELIRLALAGAGNFKGDAVREQLRVLAGVDVLILNEVDLGMARTGYRDVARELAAGLRMNYAFGVEFVEMDGLDGADLKLETRTRSRLAKTWRRSGGTAACRAPPY